MENIIHLPIQFFAEDGGTESAATQETAIEEDNWENAFADESVDTQTEPAAEEPEAEPTEQQPEEQPEQMVQITHLGEVKEVPLSEAITLAQKGMDYDHVRQERDELKNAPENALMDYFAQKGGMTRAEYIESLRQQMEQWMTRVGREYDALRTEVEATISHAADQLDKAGKCLEQVSALLSDQDVALEELSRAYDSTAPDKVPAPVPLEEEP